MVDEVNLASASLLSVFSRICLHARFPKEDISLSIPTGAFRPLCSQEPALARGLFVSNKWHAFYAARQLTVLCRRSGNYYFLRNKESEIFRALLGRPILISPSNMRPCNMWNSNMWNMERISSLHAARGAWGVGSCISEHSSLS